MAEPNQPNQPGEPGEPGEPEERDTRPLATGVAATSSVSSTPDEPTGRTDPSAVGARVDRRHPDLLTLVFGLVSLTGAAVVLSGWTPDPRWLDLRWALAGAAVVLGLVLLAGTLRPSRNRTTSRPAPPLPPS